MMPYELQGKTYPRGSTPDIASCYQTAINSAPELTVVADDAADVQRAVDYAADNHLPIGVRGTGHGATSINEGMLISTNRLNQVEVDPHNRIARVGAGATWETVVHEAARHGLAPLSGSASTVGVVGYTLGGGVGPLVRQFGYAAEHVTTIDAVTADGRRRRVTADSEPDLYWAMRGGGGSFAIALALEIELFPVDQVLAGALTFDPARFSEVIDRYQRWSLDVPASVTTSLSYMTFPDNPTLPEHIRGKRSLRIFVTCIDIDRAPSALDSMRTWSPTDDTVRLMPYAQCSEVFAEPTTPHGYQGDALATSRLDPVAAESVQRQIAAETENCMFLQVHHVGGTHARPPTRDSAIGHRTARYIVRVTTPVLQPAPAGLADQQDALISGLAGGATTRALNFLFGDNDSPLTTKSCYEADTYERLLAVKRRYDPANRLRLGRTLRAEN